MNNQAIAWMNKRTNKCVVFINTPPSDDWIPLYTHPPAQQWTIEAKFKELTDEEIYQIGKEYLTQYEDGLIEFAKAILRKAQEK